MTDPNADTSATQLTDRRWGVVLDLVLVVASVATTQYVLEATSEYKFELILVWLIGVSVAGIPVAIACWLRGDGPGKFLGLWMTQGICSMAGSLLLWNFDSFDLKDFGLIVQPALIGWWALTYVGVECGVLVATFSKRPTRVSERLACVVQLGQAALVSLWMYYYFRYGGLDL